MFVTISGVALSIFLAEKRRNTRWMRPADQAPKTIRHTRSSSITGKTYSWATLNYFAPDSPHTFGLFVLSWGMGPVARQAGDGPDGGCGQASRSQAKTFTELTCVPAIGASFLGALVAFRACLSDPTEITPPYRKTGVATPLSHCVSCGIADYRCYTPT